MSPFRPKRCSRRMTRSALTRNAFRTPALALALLWSLTLFVPGVLSRGGQGGGRPVPTPTPKKQGGPKNTGPTPEPIRRYRCPPASQLSHAPQRRTRPATPQQGAGNANTQRAERKHMSPPRSSDTADGSRITITSDAPLNDYSAYRSGDTYYVVIPEANAPTARGGLRGRGFEDFQIQQRGNAAVFSFKIQPGANARTEQRFNRIDVELTAPAAKTTDASTTPTPAAASPEPTPAEPRATTPAAGPVRAVAGRQFRCEEGVWVDTAYDSSQTMNVARDSAAFRSLTGEDPSIKVIAQRFVGELIVMWKGRAYRIR
jgi:hypothetical protein